MAAKLSEIEANYPFCSYIPVRVVQRFEVVITVPVRPDGSPVCEMRAFQGQCAIDADGVRWQIVEVRQAILFGRQIPGKYELEVRPEDPEYDKPPVDKFTLKVT